MYTDGFSQGELRDFTSLASLREVAHVTELLYKVWDAWREEGVPRQASKELVREEETDVLGCRTAGKFGRILHLPRAASELLSLLARNAEPSPCGRTQLEAQIVGGRSVRAFQLRREIWCVFSQFWRGGTERRPLSFNVLEEFQLAVFLLWLCDSRTHVSPWMLPAMHPDSGMVVCRTSALAPQGLSAAKQAISRVPTPAPCRSH